MTTMPFGKPVRRADDPGSPTATLEEVDIRSELLTRAPRPSDYEAENRAWAVLAQEMADNPRNMLQKLVEAAVELCHADTAGISLLEGDVFRWEAVAGVFASYRDGTMPRAASPCGVCIDQKVTQLMHLPDRCFPALRAEPRFVEALLLPFQVYGRPMGTVWIVSHREERKFDQEDERVVRTLTQFASAGWQLWTAREAAEKANRRKDEFLAMLGHELRNPLAAISNATHVMRAGGMTGQDATHALEVVARQSQHLTRMVDDLLDLSRISTGKLELATAPIELKDVVADAVETSRAQIEGRRHQLSVDLPGEPIWLDGDAVRLTQLIANLLDNAAKYTPAGGQIWVTARLAEKQVEIAVRDTGVGIPTHQLDTVFDLFRQLESRAEGLGLGLALVRHLAEMHGGSVRVASDGPGKGSQFTIRLTTREAPAIAPPKASASTTTARVRRILVVEDNEDVAESLAMELRLDAHEVRVAYDGPAALEALRVFTPDVVLLDVGLPGMDGFEVARLIRKHIEKSDLTIIALTGYGQEADHAQSKEAGCDAHLVKPVDRDVLKDILGRGIPSDGAQMSR